MKIWRASDLGSGVVTAGFKRL